MATTGSRSVAYGGTQNGSGTPSAMSKAAAAKAEAAARALQQLQNQRVPEYFAVIMVGLILILTLSHWTRSKTDKHASDPKASRFSREVGGLSRKFRHVLNRPLRGFTSGGHLVLVMAYLTINIALTVTNIDWSSLIVIGKRCGWMAIVNIAFITFLALKNTPLAYLLARSYERLNQLHQIAGYVTVIYVFLHLILMCEGFDQEHYLAIVLEQPQIHGIIAGSAVLVILITAILIRQMCYELFYLIHIVMSVLILVNVALHRPDFATKTIVITIFVAAIWGSDRILRLCRILSYSYKNRATITPLPNGGTKIVLRRSPSRSVPGTHCFLWIPRIRFGETHPFTIVSATSNSLEMVVKAHDGFTKDLHNYAKLHPGASLRASIDGPYGAIPDFSRTANKVVLIAGGSGATFTFGVALDLIKKLGDSTSTTIDFIWAVRQQETLSWFAQELSKLQNSPLVTVSLHTTSSPSPYCTQIPSVYCTVLPSSPSPISPTFATSDDPEKDSSITFSPVTHDSKSTSSQSVIEKRPPSPQETPWDSSSSLNTISARPDVDRIIRTVVRNAKATDRIAIVACGPASLMRAVRSTATDCITVSGPGVELHCEQFGW